MLTYPEIVRADGPSGYWRLGELSGTACADSSGNGNGGTYLNSPTLGVIGPIKGEFNRAATFDGISQAVDLPAINATVAFSVEAWVRGSTSGTFPIWSNRGGGSGVFFGTQGVQCLVYMDNFGGQSVLSNTTVVNGQWHHIVWTNDGITSLLYVDGAFDNSATTGDPRTAESNEAWIGFDAALSEGSNYFTGTIDDVSVYQKTLNASRIRLHNNVGRGLNQRLDPYGAIHRRTGN